MIWINDCPKLEFVLRHIKSWTEVGNVCAEQSNGISTVGLAELDSQISGASDSVLTAVQRVKAALADMPTSTTDDAWLVKTDKSFSQALKYMPLSSTAQILNDAMKSMQHLPMSGGEELKAASASIAMALPIVRQFSLIQQELLRRYAESHRALCRLASILAKSLSQLVSQGFCTPTEPSTSETDTTETIKSGTGLGEGQGAEDISKDVLDDENLSELAQEENREQDQQEEIDKGENVVNMDHDELEGDDGDVSGTEEDSGSGEERRNGEEDEETGKLDDLDSRAVDEKLWDGGEEHPENERRLRKAPAEGRITKKWRAKLKKRRQTLNKNHQKEKNLQVETIWEGPKRWYMRKQKTLTRVFKKKSI